GRPRPAAAGPPGCDRGRAGPGVSAHRPRRSTALPLGGCRPGAASLGRASGLLVAPGTAPSDAFPAGPGAGAGPHDRTWYGVVAVCRWRCLPPLLPYRGEDGREAIPIQPTWKSPDVA